MVDTVRSDATILSLLADNTTGDISPQDLRDMFVTLASKSSSIFVRSMQELIDGYAAYGGSKVYVPVGMIDAGTLSLEVTSENLLLAGDNYFNSGFYSTADNHTIFKNAIGEFASNLDINNCSFYASGTNSKIFDLDGTGNSGAIEFDSCNLGDFAGSTTEIGTLTGFRQFKTQNCGFFRVQDGLTFAGTWAGGFRITETIVLAQAANSTLFKVAPGLTFAGRCISDINAASVDPTTITFDFVEDNFLLDGGFQLTGASFAPNSSISVTMDETSIKAYFRDCIEIKNTRVRCLITSDTAVLNTLTANVEEKVEGTTTETYGTWLSQSDNNEIRVDTSNVIDVEVSYKCRIDGGPNDELAVSIYHYDASEDTFNLIVREVRTVSNVLGALDIVDFDIDGVVDSVTIGDYFEPRIENTSDGTDATVQIGGKLKVVRI